LPSCQYLPGSSNTNPEFKQTLTKDHIDTAWAEAENTVKTYPAGLQVMVADISTPGLLASYTGYMTTHPGILAAFIIWDSIHSHHKMEHSAAYGPFVAGIKPFLSGPIEILHFDITEPEQLKKALEAPVTQVSRLQVTPGQAAPFLEGYHTGLKKYIVGEKYKGITLLYPYEDP